jgi:hypothetical protein
LATIGVDFNFKINDNVYSSYYFLINDIYSWCLMLVQTIHEP